MDNRGLDRRGVHARHDCLDQVRRLEAQAQRDHDIESMQGRCLLEPLFQAAGRRDVHLRELRDQSRECAFRVGIARKGEQAEVAILGFQVVQFAPLFRSVRPDTKR